MATYLKRRDNQVWKNIFCHWCFWMNHEYKWDIFREKMVTKGLGQRGWRERKRQKQRLSLKLPEKLRNENRNSGTTALQALIIELSILFFMAAINISMNAMILWGLDKHHQQLNINVPITHSYTYLWPAITLQVLTSFLNFDSLVNWEKSFNFSRRYAESIDSK